jgi:D-alanyl-D-alanine carboxypeptidase
MAPYPSALIALTLAACANDGSSSDSWFGADLAVAAHLQSHLDTLHTDGMVGVVGEINDDRGRAQARSGSAQLDKNTPVALDSHFRIGSNTKTFVAVVTLQLAHEGALDLDDPVDKWLPGVVSGNGNDGTQITIRNLLQHTSGIANYTQDLFAQYNADTFPTLRFQHYEPAQLVAMALQHPPLFRAGTSWTYSNTNYVLIGMIIQKVTGNDWRVEVGRRILTPLHLTHTSTPVDEPDLPSPHASGYQQLATDAPLLDATAMNQSAADAAGSMTSTTADLTTFWRGLQAGELLGPAEMAAMHTTVPVNNDGDVEPGSRYGLGIIWYPATCGGGYWNHEGDTVGFATFNAVNDDGTRAIVVSETTLPRSAAVDTESLRLLDDAICATR